MDPIIAVRRRLATAILGGDAGPIPAEQLGSVRLRPHQVDAVRRLLRALDTHGGALLADAPGLGKTYVALAVARACGSAIVVAPAALRHQWQRSAAMTGLPIEWASMETLSRRPIRSRAALLIADEAHHLRNPHTQRYAHAAALALGKRVLLVSATPVHNRAVDRDALFGLFLGDAAARLPARTLAHLIVRRDADGHAMPLRRAVRWLRPPPQADVADLLRTLPPPLPAADGRAALALLRLILAHAWSSSIAALEDTLNRLILRAAALDDALAAGRWPTRHELRAWMLTSTSSQLAFPELVATPAARGTSGAREALEAHVRALRTLRRRVAASRAADTAARGAQLRAVMARHPAATVIAFSRYAGTIDALWCALRLEPGIVAITAQRVRSAGDGLRRQDVLGMLAATATPTARTPLRLLLSTDLLGEGLDLRAASVIVHLDQPWTPARLEQREGRALRLDSPHQEVHVYAMRSPHGAARLLAIGKRLQAKRTAMRAGVAPGAAREALMELVRPWLATTGGAARVAAVRSDTAGWIAALCDGGGRTHVLRGARGAVTEDDDSLLDALRQIAVAASVDVPATQLHAARREIQSWRRSAESAWLARTQQGGESVRARIQQRLDRALRSVPLHQRSTVEPRIMAARAHLATLRGAGAEFALTEAARLEDLDALCRAVSQIASPQTSEGPATRTPRLLALMLLVPES
ncbi:MAG TPA: helicase-related protein [Gemmatimonadaceae bacterium]